MKDILTIAVSIAIPLLVALISSRHHFRRVSTEEFATSVERAKEFYTILHSDDPILIKDTVAQKFLGTKKINFREAEYFAQFDDMQKWVRRYIEHRNEFSFDYAEDGKIEKIYILNPRRRVIMSNLIYVVFATGAIVPFLWFDWYADWFFVGLNEHKYLLIFNLVIYPFLSALLALISVYRGECIKSAREFLQEFNLKR